MARTRTWANKMIGIYITRSVLHGASYTEAGNHYGIRNCAARETVHRTLRAAMFRTRLQQPFPPHDYTRLEDIREHQAFWLRQLAVLQAEWSGVEDKVRA